MHRSVGVINSENVAAITLSDAKQHDVAVQLASKLLGESRSRLLKFALSLRVHSPSVQLFQQLGGENKVNCDAYAVVHGEIVCDAENLEHFIMNADERYFAYES
ncbi:unnamed protein product [Anisakis simplex]|uniref:Thioredoxin_12 domain-containing protein n=1 Tax=Anisakis simplex TaxID=6269 RepID=A0A0M3KC88_ANISI|nr:unnamed protein product [Anisakis simplex]